MSSATTRRTYSFLALAEILQDHYTMSTGVIPGKVLRIECVQTDDGDVEIVAVFENNLHPAQQEPDDEKDRDPQSKRAK